MQINEKNDAGIILFPDFEHLKNEVEKLRTELSMLVLERDELRFDECRNLEMVYMLKFGSLEYRAYKAQCTMLRLKRKIDLIQARRNRQEKVILSHLESILDMEFAEYQDVLNEKIEDMNRAIRRSRCEVLSMKETKELKKLYRKIVKVLHPDLNPDITPAQKELFYNAVLAYENGDLQTLRLINEMVSEPGAEEYGDNAIVGLAHESERLKKLIQGVQEEIAHIKSEFPYTMKELLKDEDKVAAYRAELEEVICQYEEAISVYEARIEEMLRC